MDKRHNFVKMREFREERSCHQAEKTRVRRLIVLIQAYFAEKVSFAENSMYIYRINCGE